jgi:hypothetical protein
MEYTIKPTLFPKYALRIKIDVQVQLGESATVRVSFYEENEEFTPLDCKVFLIQGEEYKAWGNDDNYIKDLVFTKLGISQEIIEA